MIALELAFVQTPLKKGVALLAESFFYFLIGVGCRNRKRDRKVKHNGLWP